MPNGGSDNCSNCLFNGAQRLHLVGDSRDAFIAESCCELRGLNITDPFYTYCQNFIPAHTREPVGSPKIKGPAFAHGFIRRIPWNGNVEPKMGAVGACHICGKPTDHGIGCKSSTHQDLVFCSDEHYMLWINR